MLPDTQFDRRAIFAGIVGLTALPVRAGQWCGPQFCTVGLAPNSWSRVYATQQASNWCWAASIQMLFAAAGHRVGQASIVSTAYGGLVNLPAFQARQIAMLTNHRWVDDDGNEFDCRLVAAYDYFSGVAAINNADILASLSNGNPLIYCNNHHAMLLVGADFTNTPYGPQVLGFHLFDPWPGMGLRRASQAEFYPAHAGGIMTYIGECQID